MAKRRGGRDTSNPIANDPLSVLIAPVRSPYSPPTNLDRRTYHPEGPNRPFLSVEGVVNTITTETTNDRQPVRSKRSKRLAYSPKVKLVFDGVSGPSRPSVCQRREVRKEVLFAKGKGGSRHPRKVRRNETSKYGC